MGKLRNVARRDAWALADAAPTRRRIWAVLARVLTTFLHQRERESPREASKEGLAEAVMSFGLSYIGINSCSGYDKDWSLEFSVSSNPHSAICQVFHIQQSPATN